MTAEIDQKRAEVKAKRAANPSTAKKGSPSRDSTNSSKRATSSSKKTKKAKKPKTREEPSNKSTEERFRLLIREVQKRVDEIELKKGDYQTYAEVQNEVDAFLGEAVTDILAIKASLKKRFDAAQAGRSGASRRVVPSSSRSKSRKPRNRASRRRSPTDAEPVAAKAANAENSVFSTDQIHHAD